MVPEYLTPTNGGLLSPGQLVALSRAVLGRYGGPGVAQLVLEITPDVMVGKVSIPLKENHYMWVQSPSSTTHRNPKIP
jgi:hypothetical protein